MFLHSFIHNLFLRAEIFGSQVNLPSHMYLRSFIRMFRLEDVGYTEFLIASGYFWNICIQFHNHRISNMTLF